MEPPAGVLQDKNLDSPDETRSFENGKLDVVELGNVTVRRAIKLIVVCYCYPMTSH